MRDERVTDLNVIIDATVSALPVWVDDQRINAQLFAETINFDHSAQSISLACLPRHSCPKQTKRQELEMNQKTCLPGRFRQTPENHVPREVERRILELPDALSIVQNSTHQGIARGLVLVAERGPLQLRLRLPHRCDGIAGRGERCVRKPNDHLAGEAGDLR
jgi:hypothetical protein